MFKKMMLVVVCVAMLVPAQAARADTGPVQRLGTGIPTSIAASPDGTTLAVGSSIGVWFLDVVTLTPNGFWDTGVWVDSVAYSVDGRYVLADKMVYEVASSRVVEVSEVNWLDHRCSFDKRLCIEQNIQDGYVYSTKVVDTNTLVVAKILEVGVQDMA